MKLTLDKHFFEVDRLATYQNSILFVKFLKLVQFQQVMSVPSLRIERERGINA